MKLIGAILIKLWSAQASYLGLSDWCRSFVKHRPWRAATTTATDSGPKP